MRTKKLLIAAFIGLASLALPVAVQPASAAIPFERDYATGDVFETWNCQTIDGASGCFYPTGDYFTVADMDSDGHSGAAEWENYTSNGLYRHGWCIDNKGAMTWGSCNKNFIEGSQIRLRACTYESGTGLPVECSAWGPKVTA